MRPLPLLSLLACLISLSPAFAAEPAKVLFSRPSGPAPLESRSIGSYARGCMAGGMALPINGPAWQVMRLSRNRNWGTPQLVDFLERLATDVRAHDGWQGLLVGDMSQPRGGPMLTGHASHQIGLDADIWLTPMPDRTLTPKEREEISATSVLKDGVREVDPKKWSESKARLIKRAASYPEVARIFVHPAIKKTLCQWAGNDGAWLNKVRPWWGHHYHFHVRLQCPPGMAGCESQQPPPPGDGCGAELTDWLSPKRWTPAPPPKKPVKPPPEKTLADLPAACTEVLYAGTSGPAAAPIVPLPRLKPAGAGQ